MNFNRIFKIQSLIKNILKKNFYNSCNTQQLGRWKIENDFKKTKIKIDLANIDNCGPCGYKKNNKS
jgi:hypothetical protein